MFIYRSKMSIVAADVQFLHCKQASVRLLLVIILFSLDITTVDSFMMKGVKTRRRICCFNWGQTITNE